ncbi:hypothetical protein JavanS168_0022 [Streptococcus satellite phage Javan168]|nr:hypothetical protein JavanS168_0022 [Streptococcus satellite phage Javan168]
MKIDFENSEKRVVANFVYVKKTVQINFGGREKTRKEIYGEFKYEVS